MCGRRWSRWCGGRVQEFIQEILEDEVTEFLGGRAKSQRRASVEGGRRGYRNGYGKPRKPDVGLGDRGGVPAPGPRRGGTVREPGAAAVRAADEGGGRAGGAAVPARPGRGDFELALRGLLGDGAPLSKSTVRRLRERWVAEHAAWERRSLAGRELVYAWADGIYVKAGLEKDKAALLVVIGAMADGTKEVLAVAPGFRESAESWAAVLRGLKARGLGVPKLLVADGNLGIWAAARQVWPEAGEQRCWNHKMANVLDRLPKREQTEAKRLLREVVYAESRAGAEKARDAFADRYADTYPKAVEILAGDWGRMTAFYDFPAGHWRHLRTTNVVESPFAAVRLRTSAAKRVQEGRRRHGADLEAPHGRREAVPEAQRPPPAARGARGQAVRRRQARPRTGTARGLTTVCDLRSVQRGPPKDGAHQSRPGGRRGKTPTRQHRPIGPANGRFPANPARRGPRIRPQRPPACLRPTLTPRQIRSFAPTHAVATSRSHLDCRSIADTPGWPERRRKTILNRLPNVTERGHARRRLHTFCPNLLLGVGIAQVRDRAGVC